MKWSASLSFLHFILFNNIQCIHSFKYQFHLPLTIRLRYRCQCWCQYVYEKKIPFFMEISTLPNQIQYPFHCYSREKNILRFAAIERKKISLLFRMWSSFDDRFCYVIAREIGSNRKNGRKTEWNVNMST